MQGINNLAVNKEKLIVNMSQFTLGKNFTTKNSSLCDGEATKEKVICRSTWRYSIRQWKPRKALKKWHVGVIIVSMVSSTYSSLHRALAGAREVGWNAPNRMQIHRELTLKISIFMTKNGICMSMRGEKSQTLICFLCWLINKWTTMVRNRAQVLI